MCIDDVLNRFWSVIIVISWQSVAVKRLWQASSCTPCECCLNDVFLSGVPPTSFKLIYQIRLHWNILLRNTLPSIGFCLTSLKKLGLSERERILQSFSNVDLQKIQQLLSRIWRLRSLRFCGCIPPWWFARISVIGKFFTSSLLLSEVVIALRRVRLDRWKS